MKKYHIAFFSFPHDPHLNPSLPIVSVLVRRGHRVTYVASTRFTPRLERLEAEVVTCPPFHTSSVLENATEDTQRERHPFCRLAVRTLAEVAPFYEANRPDVVIYDLVAFAGRILAKRYGIPAIQMSPQFALNREAFGDQVLDAAFRQELLSDGEEADTFLRHHGVAAEGFLFHKERLNIYFFPKALQPKGTVFDKASFFAGRCAGEQPSYGNWDSKSAGGRPVVLVSTSTSYVRGPEYFSMCINALTDLNLHVLLSIGDQADAAALGRLPPHCEVIQHTAHIRILPHAKLFVCLGGTMSSSEAAYHGVPLVVTTHGIPELVCMGDNIERVGLGVHLRNSQMTVETLTQAAVHVMTDQTLLARVAELQHSIRMEPGAEETANCIEDYLLYAAN